MGKKLSLVALLFAFSCITACGSGVEGANEQDQGKPSTQNQSKWDSFTWDKDKWN